MSTERLFFVAEFQQPADGEPIRSVITESADAVVVAWYVKPGQRIGAHVHPNGQDTWTILSGTGQYQIDGQGSTKRIGPGIVVVAHRGEVHGVYNDGTEPLEFVSVVAPAAAAY
jgi:quercetin dioxygenase-like cupin family protein